MKTLHLTFLTIGFLSVFLVSCAQTPEVQATRTAVDAEQQAEGDWATRYAQEAEWSQTIEAGGGVSPFEDKNPEPTQGSVTSTVDPTNLPTISTQIVAPPAVPAVVVEAVVDTQIVGCITALLYLVQDHHHEVTQGFAYDAFIRDRERMSAMASTYCGTFIDAGLLAEFQAFGIIGGDPRFD